MYTLIYRCLIGAHRKIHSTVEKKSTIKNDVEQIGQANSDLVSAISRRQFSLGLSGILFTGIIAESVEHNTLSAIPAKTSTLPIQSDLQKLPSQVFNRPQYVLSSTTGSAWSPDSRHIAT